MKPSTGTGNIYAYCRVSTDEQSVEQQKTLIREYVKLRGLKAPEFFCDLAESGTLRLVDRPAGGQLLKTLKPGDEVVVVRLDRIFRRASDGILTLENWVKKKINLHIIDMGGDSISLSSPIGRLVIHMMAGFAEFERSLISERTKEGLKHRIGHPPIGYKIINTPDPSRKRGMRGTIVVCPEEREQIRQLLEWKNQGYVAEEIYHLARKAKLMRKNRGPQANKTIPWTLTTIRAIVNKRTKSLADFYREEQDIADGLDDRPDA